MMLARWPCLRRMADLLGGWHSGAIGFAFTPGQDVIAVQEQMQRRTDSNSDFS
jgi:hypothetical protein